MLNVNQKSVNIHRVQLITERDEYKSLLEHSLLRHELDRAKYRVIIAILLTLLVVLIGSLLYVSRI